MPKFEGVYRAGNGSWYFKASLGRDPLTGKRICRLPATWDQVAAGFASGMGPPLLPVIGPPEGPPTPAEESLGWVSDEEARWRSGRFRWSRSERRCGAG